MMDNDEGVVVSPIYRCPSEIPEVSLIDYIFPKIKTNLPLLGEKPCFVDVESGKSVKFRELEDLTLRVASSLASLGFKQSDVLYHVTWETAHLCVVQFAVWRLGGAWRGRHHVHLVEEYTRDMRDSEVKFVLVDEDSAPTLRKAISALDWPVKLLCFGDVDGATSVSEMLQDDGTAMPEHVTINPREDVAAIICTSGSTGPAKGALHTHYTGVALMEVFRGFKMPLDVNGSFLTTAMNFAAGQFINLLYTMMKGNTLFLIGNLKKVDYLKVLLKYKPTSAMMFPQFAINLSRHPEIKQIDLQFLQNINIGGWNLDAATVEEFTRVLPSLPITQSYAMSETLFVTTTIISQYTNANNVRSVQIIEYQGERYTSSGLLVPFMKAKVVDTKTGKTLPRGERGEIRLKSPTIMLGYLQPGSKDLNRKDFDAEGWFCTGDLGFFDSSGNLYIIERLNFTYKHKIYPVFPSEIEAVLQDHEAVHTAGVVGIPEPEVDCLSRAFVVLRPGHHVSADELQKHVADRLPEHKHLHGGVRFIAGLPLSNAGKLDRRKLREIALNSN